MRSNGQGSANTLPICEATYVAAEDSGDCEVGDHVKIVKGPQEATWDSVATFHLAALLINLEDKGEKITKEISILQQKAREITNGQNHGAADIVVYEEGQSAEPVANICNSSGSLQECDCSSDSSLKWG
ncbi:hypothetical protein Nepgr_008123 [Nepenthes gracilis]|uniref:Uncharacterized protein n=1 Tax=Nepenthes gracilis TaxID=150966 RepID=A0AAD3XIY6_NEPGR|nr:hypothetical protein Nepgr_008123 [Nepenthes gracilis]